MRLLRKELQFNSTPTLTFHLVFDKVASLWIYPLTMSAELKKWKCVQRPSGRLLPIRSVERTFNQAFTVYGLV